MDIWTLFNPIRSLFTAEVIWTILWVASGLFTMALLVLMRTRWGQARPLVKCVILSVLAHVLLLGYAQMTRLFESTSYGRGTDYSEEIRQVTPVTPEELNESRPPDQPLEPWERFEPEETVTPTELSLTRESVAIDTPPARREIDLPENVTGGIPLLEPITQDVLQPGEFSLPIEPRQERTTAVESPTIEAPSPESRTPIPSTQPEGQQLSRADTTGEQLTKPSRDIPTDLPDELQTGPDLQRLSAMSDQAHNPDRHTSRDGQDAAAMPRTAPHRISVRNPAVSSGPPIEGLAEQSIDNAPSGQSPTPISGQSGTADQQTAPNEGAVASAPPKQLINGRELPEVYRLRVLDDRIRVAEENGGNRRTEAAVQAALAWLVANQEKDGRWDASRHGAGKETKVFGHAREGAGENSDTGITALALLALMGAGNTHVEGDYRENVQKGLEFLLRSQGRDGNMSGGAKTFAATYCHSMATFAISEAYDLTGDERLKPWVQRAVGYTLSTQNKKDGGWRYRPGDAGDTSQFGWQVMALKAAAQSGIPIPNDSRIAMRVFLNKISSGRHGGLASYRPSEAISQTMTAEALVCRFFLGIDPEDPSIDEAANYLVRHKPADGKLNLYYLYYGTLAMQQVNDERWDAWNESMQEQLIGKQLQAGRGKGTWDPDKTLWGGYGGRVYTTAVGALILESYYRYAPK